MLKETEIAALKTAAKICDEQHAYATADSVLRVIERLAETVVCDHGPVWTRNVGKHGAICIHRDCIAKRMERNYP